MVFGVLPVVMGLGTVALVIAEYTPVLVLLGRHLTHSQDHTDQFPIADPRWNTMM